MLKQKLKILNEHGCTDGAITTNQMQLVLAFVNHVWSSSICSNNVHSWPNNIFPTFAQATFDLAAFLQIRFFLFKKAEVRTQDLLAYHLCYLTLPLSYSCSPFSKVCSTNICTNIICFRNAPLYRLLAFPANIRLIWKWMTVTRNPYWEGRISTVGPIALTSLDQLHLKMQTLFTLCWTSYLNKEV